jgi:hypothetical protein
MRISFHRKLKVSPKMILIYQKKKKKTVGVAQGEGTELKPQY